VPHHQPAPKQAGGSAWQHQQQPDPYQAGGSCYVQTVVVRLLEPAVVWRHSAADFWLYSTDGHARRYVQFTYAGIDLDDW
jgi:hypothetical protein